MNDIQILTALSDLEAHLQGINSAKEQVEQVTRSYSLVESQFSTLRADMSAVSKDIKDIIDIIRGNQEALNGQIFDMAKSRLSAFGSGVEELERKANEIHTLFQSDCDKGLKSLNDSTSAAVTTFRGNLDQVNKAQETALSRMIVDFQTSIDKYLSEVNKLTVDFKAQLDAFSTKHQQLLDDIKAALSDFNTDVTGKLNKLQGDLASSAKSIEENGKDLANAVSTKVDVVSAKVDDTATKIQKSMEDIKGAVFERLDEMENRQKKVFTFSLIAMIAAFLSLIMIIVVFLK